MGLGEDLGFSLVERVWRLARGGEWNLDMGRARG